MLECCPHSKRKASDTDSGSPPGAFRLFGPTSDDRYGPPRPALESVQGLAESNVNQGICSLFVNQYAAFSGGSLSQIAHCRAYIRHCGDTPQIARVHKPEQLATGHSSVYFDWCPEKSRISSTLSRTPSWISPNPAMLSPKRSPTAVGVRDDLPRDFSGLNSKLSSR
jgi:hypothetical protein